MIAACSPGADAEARVPGCAGVGGCTPASSRSSWPRPASRSRSATRCELGWPSSPTASGRSWRRRRCWGVISTGRSCRRPAGRPAEVVSRALARAVDRVLVTADGAGFQFRHALTREAVLTIHAAAPAAPGGVDRAGGDRRRPPRPGGRLAGRGRRPGSPGSGDRTRAGRLLRDSGRYSLRGGGPGDRGRTRCAGPSTCSRAVRSAPAPNSCLSRRWPWPAGSTRRPPLRPGSSGGWATTRRPGRPESRPTCVWPTRRCRRRGGRWPVITSQEAVGLAAARVPIPSLSARAAVLSAEVALAGDDLDGARRTAEQVLAMDGAGPDVRCHALRSSGAPAAPRPAGRRGGLRGGACHRRAARPAGVAAASAARAGHR